MRRVLAWLRHGRGLHADVISGRYALRRENEALTDALAECKAERDRLSAELDAVRGFMRRQRGADDG